MTKVADSYITLQMSYYMFKWKTGFPLFTVFERYIKYTEVNVVNNVVNLVFFPK